MAGSLASGVGLGSVGGNAELGWDSVRSETGVVLAWTLPALMVVAGVAERAVELAADIAPPWHFAGGRYWDTVE